MPVDSRVDCTGLILLKNGLNRFGFGASEMILLLWEEGGEIYTRLLLERKATMTTDGEGGRSWARTVRTEEQKLQK